MLNYHARQQLTGDSCAESVVHTDVSSHQSPATDEACPSSGRDIVVQVLPHGPSANRIPEIYMLLM